MPLFIYRCQKKKCAHEFEEFFHRRDEGENVLCPKCGHICHRLMSSGKFKIETSFEPHLNEDLGWPPVMVKSPEHFQEECRKRGFKGKKMPERLK